MDFKQRYGVLDRILYRAAFQFDVTQRVLADLEKVIYRDKLKEISIDNPVFITALPRSGTTILLKLLWQTGEFATHTYQDMPFVLCPLLWNRYSKHFAKKIEPRERTHGDGIQITEESPEAFEEVVWKLFWPDHYQKDKIEPWNSERNQRFNEFFKEHMRRVIVARQQKTSGQGRYLSKNNLNIARLGSTPEPLELGIFLIPFRNPVQQAASMLQQHRRLSSIQEEDQFVKDYMEAIGHYEFGKTLRPINFNGWVKENYNPSKLSFWIEYWIEAYRFVLNHISDSIVLISYERLVEDSESTLSQLEGILGLAQGQLTSQAGKLHSPRSHSTQQEKLPETLLQKASGVHQRLKEKAVN